MKPSAPVQGCALAVSLLLLATAHPAAAQQDVMRDVYGFFGSSLEVHVATEAPGRVQFIRGRRSRIEVAGRAPNGFASAALGGRGVQRLTLAALGPDRVDFVVTVPEDVRVRVRWQGSGRSELFGGLSETATFDWDANERRPAFETVRPADHGRPSTASTSAIVTGVTPRTLDIEHAERLDRLTIRIEGRAFDVSAPGALDLRATTEGIALTAPDEGDITVYIPRGQSMTLRLDGVDAVTIDGDDVRVTCEAVLAQVLPDGRRWLTFTPTPERGCARTPGTPHRTRPAPATRRT